MKWAPKICLANPILVVLAITFSIDSICTNRDWCNLICLDYPVNHFFHSPPQKIDQDEKISDGRLKLVIVFVKNSRFFSPKVDIKSLSKWNNVFYPFKKALSNAVYLVLSLKFLVVKKVQYIFSEINNFL
jgi:hypothetical protein